MSTLRTLLAEASFRIAFAVFTAHVLTGTVFIILHVLASPMHSLLRPGLAGRHHRGMELTDS